MSLPTGGGGKRIAKLFAYVFACLLAVSAIALLLWWLPGRTTTGYILPDSQGVIAQTPNNLWVIWIRPWPWSTVPPAVTVTMNLPGRGAVSYFANALSVSFFSARAVPVELSLSSNSSPFRKSGLISDIKLVWQGGSAQRTLTDFWAVRAHQQTAPQGQVAGYALLITSQSPHPSLNVPIGLLLSPVPHRIIAVSTPNPTISPWRTPLCVSVESASSATSGSQTASIVHAMSAAACSNMKGPQAIVETGKNPTTPVAFYWEAIVQEVTRGRITTVSSGAGESGFGVWPDAFNWWRFTRRG